MTHSVNGRVLANTGMSVPFVEAPTQFPSALREWQLTRSKLEVFKKASTPVKWQEMLPWLQIFPDRWKAQLLTKGFRDGFRLLQYKGSGCNIVRNLKSVDRIYLRMRCSSPGLRYVIAGRRPCSLKLRRDDGPALEVMSGAGAEHCGTEEDAPASAAHT